MSWNHATVRFARLVHLDSLTLQGEMPLNVDLTDGWVHIYLEVNGATRAHALPASAIDSITWDTPKPLPQIMVHGGL